MRLFIVLFFIALSACTTTSGKPLDQGFINSIEVGQTTLAQVKEEMGEPLALTRTANGDFVMNWGYAKVSGPGRMESEGIDITFGPDGLVKDYKYQTYNP